jgi:hypothetical protein
LGREGGSSRRAPAHGLRAHLRSVEGSSIAAILCHAHPSIQGRRDRTLGYFFLSEGIYEIHFVRYICKETFAHIDQPILRGGSGCCGQRDVLARVGVRHGYAHSGRCPRTVTFTTVHPTRSPPSLALLLLRTAARSTCPTEPTEIVCPGWKGVVLGHPTHRRILLLSLVLPSYSWRLLRSSPYSQTMLVETSGG